MTHLEYLQLNEILVISKLRRKKQIKFNIEITIIVISIGLYLLFDYKLVILIGTTISLLSMIVPYTNQSLTKKSNKLYNVYENKGSIDDAMIEINKK